MKIETYKLTIWKDKVTPITVPFFDYVKAVLHRGLLTQTKRDLLPEWLVGFSMQTHSHAARLPDGLNRASGTWCWHLVAAATVGENKRWQPRWFPKSLAFCGCFPLLAERLSILTVKRLLLCYMKFVFVCRSCLSSKTGAIR